MLRITRIDRADVGPTLKLEGRLVGPWIEVEAQECGINDSSGEYPALDLAAVAYVDAEGAELLRSLLAANFTIVASSGYVAALLEGDRR